MDQVPAEQLTSREVEDRFIRDNGDFLPGVDSFSVNSDLAKEDRENYLLVKHLTEEMTALRQAMQKLQEDVQKRQASPTFDDQSTFIPPERSVSAPTLTAPPPPPPPPPQLDPLVLKRPVEVST
jgi:hypothetical protein